MLVVDSNSTIRAQAVRALRAAGFRPLEAASLAQARPLLGASLDFLVVADRLPDGMAADLVAGLRVPVVVLASTPDSEPAARALAVGAREAIDRQAVANELVAAVRRATARKPPPLPGPGRAPRPTPPLRKVASPQPPTAALLTRPAPAASGPAQGMIGTLREELTYLRGTNYYRVLGVAPSATAAELADAFAGFAETWHPDHLAAEASPEMRAVAAEIYELGRTAFEVLIDPKRRAQYKPPRTLVPRKTSARPPAHLFDDVALPPPPPHADPRFHEGERLLRAGEAAEAGVALGELLAAEPDYKPARALLHVVAAVLAAERPDFARAELEAALAEDPTCLEAAALLERVEDQRAAERHTVLERILPDSPGAPAKREIIEAIVLAFTHSQASALVGTDALRMVLDGQYVSMVGQPSILDLTPLWTLLKQQPGFQADQVLPPLCRLKSWESALKRTVALPAELAQLRVVEIAELAARCPVPDGALERTLRPGVRTPPDRAAARPIGRTARIEVLETVTVADQKRKRRAVRAVALSMLAFAVSALLSFGGGPRSLAPASLGQGIPIAEAHLSGEVVGIILKDPSWTGRPIEERRRAMAEVFERAQALGASGVVVMDAAGVIRAIAAPSESGDKPDITLP